MAETILQINFKLNISRTEYEEAFRGAAQPIADMPGLRWKVWLMNEAEGEAGGIYLFDDEAAARAFLALPMIASLKDSPVLYDMTVKLFGISPELTAITRGPIQTLVTA